MTKEEREKENDDGIHLPGIFLKILSDQRYPIVLEDESESC